MPEERDEQDVAGTLLDMDESIISIGVIDAKNGQTLSRAMKTDFIEKYARDEDLMEGSGMWVTIASSILQQLDYLFSETQAIVIIRKDIKQLILPVPSRGIVITASFDAADDGEALSSRIREYLCIS